MTAARLEEIRALLHPARMRTHDGQAAFAGQAEGIVGELLEEVERLRAERDAQPVKLLASEGEPFEFEHYCCPNCQVIISQRVKGSTAPLHKPKHCADCGQKLEWIGRKEG